MIDFRKSHDYKASGDVRGGSLALIGTAEPGTISRFAGQQSFRQADPAGAYFFCRPALKKADLGKINVARVIRYVRIGVDIFNFPDEHFM